MKEDIFSKIKNKTDFMRFLGIIVVVLLIIIEVVIWGQFITESFTHPRKIIFGCLVGCSLLLDVFCVVEIYAVKALSGKIAMYCFEFVLLLAVCLMTGNVYLVTLYCIILTLSYISLPRWRDEIIIFSVACVVFSVSFVCGWYMSNIGADMRGSAVEVVSELIFGLLLLAAHFAVTNFLLKFYRNNQRLTQALKEADESRAQLKEVYEQLSQSAVYEERNRIAGDIHDNAGHSMTTVIMQTEAAKKLIDTNPEEAKKAIISANIQAKNALEQMRESVHLLAGRKDVDSLKTEIEEIVAQTIDGTDLKIRCDLEDIEANEAELRFITTSVKEALANGMRHGGATAFYIELKRSFNEYTILVSDNGCGLKKDFEEGFGLRQMRLKAEALGGNVKISGEDGEGCELVITLPIRKQV